MASVPLALLDKLFRELTRMESEGILAKVTEPTQNSLVVVETNNKLRVYLDPRYLNKAIQRPHYPHENSGGYLPRTCRCQSFLKT